MLVQGIVAYKIEVQVEVPEGTPPEKIEEALKNKADAISKTITIKPTVVDYCKSDETWD